MNICVAREHFAYNPDTGELIRLTRKNSNGSVDHYGYLVIKFKRKQYKAHRLAWLLHFGAWPEGVIDHINANKLDNRIDNLRDVSQAENVRSTSRKKNSKTGVVGVYIDTCTPGLKKVFTTRLQGKTHRFYNLEDAVKFRRKNGLNV